jgi:hypothetical protein
MLKGLRSPMFDSGLSWTFERGETGRQLIRAVVDFALNHGFFLLAFAI